MTKPLGNYLHDHLAGANYAINLLEFMCDQHQDDALGPFLAGLQSDIEQDRDVLRSIAERVGHSGSTVKEAVSWLGEKMSRLKLGPDRGHGLATFEALEFLTVGILGKRALWRALNAVAAGDSRLAGFNFDELIDRAQQQYEQVEQRRLNLAQMTLTANESAPARNSNHHKESPIGKGAIVGSVAVTLAVALGLLLLPDIVRYKKLRSL